MRGGPRAFRRRPARRLGEVLRSACFAVAGRWTWGFLALASRSPMAKLALLRQTIFDELRNRGFAVKWCVLEASHAGAPQCRPRWFALARGGPAPLPLSAHAFPEGGLEKLPSQADLLFNGGRPDPASWPLPRSEFCTGVCTFVHVGERCHVATSGVGSQVAVLVSAGFLGQAGRRCVSSARGSAKQSCCSSAPCKSTAAMGSSGPMPCGWCRTVESGMYIIDGVGQLCHSCFDHCMAITHWAADWSRLVFDETRGPPHSAAPLPFNVRWLVVAFACRKD